MAVKTAQLLKNRQLSKTADHTRKEYAECQIAITPERRYVIFRAFIHLFLLVKLKLVLTQISRCVSVERLNGTERLQWNATFFLYSLLCGPRLWEKELRE